MTVEITTRRLVERDVLGDFDSGTPALDNFLHCYAKQNQRRRLSATWLAVAEDDIVGYVTFVPGSVEPKLLEAVLPKLPRYDLPVLHLARMATDKRFIGRGVGSVLMRVVALEAVEQATRAGCAGIFTDAKPPPPVEGARCAADFYARFGFVAVRAPDACDPTTGMFLSLKQAAPLLR